MANPEDFIEPVSREHSELSFRPEEPEKPALVRQTARIVGEW